MHSENYLQWLENSSLREVVKNNYKYFLPILSDSLAVKDEETVIIADYGYPGKQIAPLLAGCYYLAAKEKNFKVKLIMQSPKSKGEAADPLVIQTLKELPQKQAVIMCLSNLLGNLGELGESYRTFCRKQKHKFASTTGMVGLLNEQFDSLIKAINIDYNKLRQNGWRIKRILDESDQIRVRTATGTDLTMNINGSEAIANVGAYNQPGWGGNIPTGEVYLPPQMGKVNGVVVIDGSIRYSEGTLVIGKPIKLTIRHGRVVNIKGPGSELLESTLREAESRAEYPERIRLIGEFGIGINPGARIVGSTILDEKTLGTAHIAMGSNYWFGGKIKTIIHLDQVFRNPKIFVDGKELKI